MQRDYNSLAGIYLSLLEDDEAKGDGRQGERGAGWLLLWLQVWQLCVLHQLQSDSVQLDCRAGEIAARGREPEHVSPTGNQLTVHQISRNSREVHIQQQQHHTACRVAGEVIQNRLTILLV